jgi:two-component system OmpR family response regulator
MENTILIVDDDPHIREIISFSLENTGMTVQLAHNGLIALQLFQQQAADLIVLDINMPEMDGLELCREIRKFSDVPILFLSSRDDEIDRILGLEIGGDDYVTKPFSPRELVARVKVILKRVYKKPVSPVPSSYGEIVQHAKLSLDEEQHQICWNGQQIALTATEFAILKQFIHAPQRVLSRHVIMKNAYQFNIHVSDRTIDSHIRHIRQKFTQAGCDCIIETLHSVGYKLSTCQ